MNQPLADYSATITKLSMAACPDKILEFSAIWQDTLKMLEAGASEKDCMLYLVNTSIAQGIG